MECVVSDSVVREYSPPERTWQALQVNGACTTTIQTQSTLLSLNNE